MGISPWQRFLRFVGHQHWLRGRDRILRVFSNPEDHKSQPFEVPFFGQVYAGDLANFIDWSVFYYGSCAPAELPVLDAIAGALRAQGKQVNFFDVGANIGHHTLFMSNRADRVFSFEPFSVVRDEMSRKLRRAGVSNVTIFPVALGEKQESHSYHPPVGANVGTGTLGDILPENASSETISVQVVRGDDFFAQNQLPPLSLVKMDVEGYEEKALEGMRETLWRDRPPLLFEIQRDGSDRGKGKRIIDLLYPDHVLYEVAPSQRSYALKPFSVESTAEALVLPAELSGII